MTSFIGQIICPDISIRIQENYIPVMFQSIGLHDPRLGIAKAVVIHIIICVSGAGIDAFQIVDKVILRVTQIEPVFSSCCHGILRIPESGLFDTSGNHTIRRQIRGKGDILQIPCVGQ